VEKINFESVRQEDLALRQRKEVAQLEQITNKEKEEFVKGIKEFIARCRQSGKYISDEEERDFLRAILRYWGTFVYNASGAYPQVDLDDLEIPAPKRHIKLSPASLAIVLALLAALLLGLVSNVLANVWQVNMPQSLFIASGVFCLALAAVLWTELRREYISVTGLPLFVTIALVGIGVFCLLGGIAWASITPSSVTPSPTPTMAPTLTSTPILTPTPMPAPYAAVEAFSIIKDGKAIDIVRPDETINVTVGESILIRAEASTNTDFTDLMFTWHTCRTGDRMVVLGKSVFEMPYEASDVTGPDCITVKIEKGGALLNDSLIWVNVHE
jgi:hypothetical protein